MSDPKLNDYTERDQPPRNEHQEHVHETVDNNKKEVAPLNSCVVQLEGFHSP